MNCKLIIKRNVDRPCQYKTLSLSRTAKRWTKSFAIHYQIPKNPPKEGHFFPRWSIGSKESTTPWRLPNWRQYKARSCQLILSFKLSNLFFFSCHQDYCWGSGLSDPCDIHRCRQTVGSSFHRSVDIDEYDI